MEEVVDNRFWIHFGLFLFSLVYKLDLVRVGKSWILSLNSVNISTCCLFHWLNCLVILTKHQRLLDRILTVVKWKLVRQNSHLAFLLAGMVEFLIVLRLDVWEGSWANHIRPISQSLRILFYVDRHVIWLASGLMLASPHLVPMRLGFPHEEMLPLLHLTGHWFLRPNSRVLHPRSTLHRRQKLHPLHVLARMIKSQIIVDLYVPLLNGHWSKSLLVSLSSRLVLIDLAADLVL